MLLSDRAHFRLPLPIPPLLLSQHIAYRLLDLRHESFVQGIALPPRRADLAMDRVGDEGFVEPLGVARDDVLQLGEASGQRCRQVVMRAGDGVSYSLHGGVGLATVGVHPVHEHLGLLLGLRVGLLEHLGLFGEQPPHQPAHDGDGEEEAAEDPERGEGGGIEELELEEGEP